MTQAQVRPEAPDLLGGYNGQQPVNQVPSDQLQFKSRQGVAEAYSGQQPVLVTGR